MINAADFYEVGLAFHGHKCPAMPLGLRAAAAAMNALGVERARDKELLLVAETGDDHAAACFTDGLMTVTGCTYGKGNAHKKYWGKMAFTLIDRERGKSVRVSLKPDFFGRMLQSPFVAQRRQGVPPQNVPPSVVDPLVARVLSQPEEVFLDIGPLLDYPVAKKKGEFETALCDACGERVFVHKLREVGGRRLCIPCAEKAAPSA
jgi:formylmethanofuran dehydrogenase subunit E